MSLSRKDTVGLALAACTVGLLVVHGGNRHRAAAPERASEIPSLPVTAASSTGLAEAGSEVLAFVDVNLVSPAGTESRGHQVVIVRNGVVVRVGAAGLVDLPSNARVIDGWGTGYLTTVREAVSSTVSHTGYVVPGSDAELLLLAADPRIDPTARHRPVGRVVGGAWRPSSPVTDGSTTVADGPAGGH